ncbi:MAG: putative lipid II flippase FtsW [bacterium]|nr:putative lipid II flippase FtsW [bacterium]
MSVLIHKIFPALAARLREVPGKFSGAQTLRRGRDAGDRDMILFALAVALTFVGLIALYPASAVVAERELGDADFFLKRQIAWFAAGFVVLLIAAIVPLSLIRRLALPGMLFALVVLLLVFIPGLGHSVSGSGESFHRWLRVGPIVFQPSEFAKIAMVVYVAAVFSKGDQLQSEYDLRKLAPPFALVLFLLLSIVLEPQYGTTLCMLGVITVMVYLSGFPMLRLVILAAATLPLLVLLVVLWEYRLERLLVWLNPHEHRYSGGYQLVTSFRAFQDGGWFGSDAGIAGGFAHRYLTYGHTDFILALFAENFGLLGVISLLALFIAFVWRAYYAVQKADAPFAFLLGAGALVMLALQAVMNMCVVTGIVPTTGVSLPFLSYGGSSLIVTLGFVGLLLNVSRSRPAPAASPFTQPLS